jgi:hypothetical protein
VCVKEICGDRIIIENELRDTTEDWFYFAFCVEGAEGRELTFEMQKNRIGYWGPAVSHDLESWHWLDSYNENSFTYKFGENESRVYFAHHILYPTRRFFDLASNNRITVSELCRSRRGRSVPCLVLGEGDETIFLTARHHACESTGSYVLEGVLSELIGDLPAGFRIACVPFVDYDGVLDGDQGKARYPHDHNRDYTADAPSIYPEVSAIRALAEKYGCRYAFDFHSPWHKGKQNDTIFMVHNTAKEKEIFEGFAALLESEITENAMSFTKENYHPANTGWNKPSPNFSFTMNSRPECRLAFTLESAYFGTEDNKVSAERLIELGRCFARAIKGYVASGN